MALKIDPRFPLVWRSPTSLQFGVDAPPFVMHDVTNAQERMIAALVAGVTRPGLSVVAEGAGASEAQVNDLLRQFAPILRTGLAARPVSSTVAIIGTGSTAARLGSALTATGIRVVSPGRPADFGVMVSHYVVAPELFGFWLRQDVPHLSIVFGDSGARIGPVIEPGAGPCLYCLDRHRTDADAAWPAIASQLWGRSSTVESAVVTSEVVAIAARLIVSRLGVLPRTEKIEREVATSVQLDAETGSVTSRDWLPHPECGCVALPGSDSAGDRAADPGLLPTTTDAAVGVPA